LHEKLELPNADILIHAGDFTSNGNLNDIKDFSNWLGTLPHKHKVIIAGNHEISFDVQYEDFLKKRFYGLKKGSDKAKDFDFKALKSQLKNCI